MAVQLCASSIQNVKGLSLLSPLSGKRGICRLKTEKCCSKCIRSRPTNSRAKTKSLILNCLKMGSLNTDGESKFVWIWTENRQVMTAAVERGWNTFLFDLSCAHLAKDWSTTALINPLYINDGLLTDAEGKTVASFFEISSPKHLDQMLFMDEMENVVIRLLDWQVIPAENIVAAFQGNKDRVFAVAETAAEAQTFLEALELGLGGVVLKVNDIGAVIKLKEYFDRSKARNSLTLIKATVNRVCVAGMGDRVCVDLCNLMRPGEGLLVGSFARGLFLVHSECLETDYIASRPFRVNAVAGDPPPTTRPVGGRRWSGVQKGSKREREEVPYACSSMVALHVSREKQAREKERKREKETRTKGPVHSYVSIPGGKTCYLSELKAGKDVIVADQSGQQRTAIVGRVKIETRPLVLVEAKGSSSYQTCYSILLQNAETVALVAPNEGHSSQTATIPVTSLKVGDEVLVKMQGGACHTGIEIQEFIVEK